MKKNFAINLAGQLFAIDEDAYQLLLDYTDTLRRYYRRQSEGEEVVDDIEARIAEIFSERPNPTAPITIEQVQEIIRRIGNLDDLTGAAEDGTSHSASPGGAKGAFETASNNIRSTWREMRDGKRFYRDTEHKKVAGVLAGLAKYFGGDVTIWRILFLILLFVPLPFIHTFQGLSGSLVLLYIIFAIVAPGADKPEEVLQMRGESVNPQSLAEEVQRRGNVYSTPDARKQRRDTFEVIFAIFMFLFSASLWMSLLGVICGAGVVAFFPHVLPADWFDPVLDPSPDAVKSVCYSLLFLLTAVGICLFCVAYCSLHAGLSLIGKARPMSLSERIGWLIVWAVSVFGIVLTGVNFTTKMSQFDEMPEKDAPALIEEQAEDKEEPKAEAPVEKPAADEKKAEEAPKTDERQRTEEVIKQHLNSEPAKREVAAPEAPADSVR